MPNQLEFFPISEYHDPIVAKIEIIQDSDDITASPREWSNLGEMVIRQAMNRYFSGDRSIDDEAMSELINRCRTESLVWLPIYAYIHSGISLSTSNTSYPFTCQWDTSFAGIIYVENDKMLEEYGDLSTRSRGLAIGYLQSEVKVYEQWLTGDIYGFRTLDPDGEKIDSCWGFYGSDPFTNGMSEHIDVKHHDLLKQAAENIKYE